MAYSLHGVALFGKKASQERLASRISALSDMTFNDDDATVQSARGELKVWKTILGVGSC